MTPTRNTLEQAIRAIVQLHQPIPRATLPGLIADNLEAKFLIIDRADIPEATVMHHVDGSALVKVAGAVGSTWPLTPLGAQRNRQWGLEYLAAAEAMETYVPEPEPVTLAIPANSNVQCTGHPTELFVYAGTFTYTPHPGTVVIITSAH